MALLEISCHRGSSPFLLELANGLIPQLPPSVGCSTSSRSLYIHQHHPSNSFLGLGIRSDWCDGLLVHIRSCDLVLTFVSRTTLDPLVYIRFPSLSVPVCCPSLFIGGQVYFFCSRVRQYVGLQYKRMEMPVERGVWDAIRIRGHDPPDRDAMHIFNGGEIRREHLKDSFALFFSFLLPPSISTSLFYAILPCSFGYN